MKYAAIYKHQNKYSISKICEFFEVSRSGYYGFLKQMDKPDKDEELSELIRKCQEQIKTQIKEQILSGKTVVTARNSHKYQS